MADPLVGLTVIVPEAGDRPTTFRQRKSGAVTTLYAGLEADAAEVAQTGHGVFQSTTFLTGAVEMPSGDWFVFVGGTGAKRTGPDTWSSWRYALPDYPGSFYDLLDAQVPRLMRGGTDLVALGYTHFSAVPAPENYECDLVALAWKWDGSEHPNNLGGDDVTISVLSSGNKVGPYSERFWAKTPGAIWQDPSGRDVAFYPANRTWQRYRYQIPGGAFFDYIFSDADFYVRVGNIYGDAWDAPILVAARANDPVFATGATLGQGRSYHAVALEPDKSALVCYQQRIASPDVWPYVYFSICTRLLTWTGTTYSVGPEVVAVGPIAYGAFIVGGMWQRKSGEACLLYGDVNSGDLHLLTSADRGTTWH